MNKIEIARYIVFGPLTGSAVFPSTGSGTAEGLWDRGAMLRQAQGPQTGSGIVERQTRGVLQSLTKIK